MRFSYLFLLLVLLISNSCYGKLKIVAEIYRHGARGSLSSYYDGNRQPEIAGELTATGQRQHYNLGQFLREEYINQMQFMPERYNHSLIYVRADDFNRTIMSAYSHFQGFYPEGFGDTLPQNLSYKYTLPPFRSPNIDLNSTASLGLNALPHRIQVLPVHVISRDTDYTFLADDICPNSSKFQNAYQNTHSEIYNYINDQMNQTLQILTQTFNQTFTTISQAESLNDVLFSDLYNGRYIPSLPDQVWKNLTFLNNFFSFYQSKEGVQIITQPYFEEIFGFFDNIISGNSALRWISHSGHDSNVGPIVNALNFSSIDCVVNDFFQKGETYLNCAEGPNFASHILFEIHESDNTKSSANPKDSLYFRVRYNGQYMNICGRNSTVCSYTEFENSIKSSFTNYNLLCGKNTTVYMQSSQLGEVMQDVKDKDGQTFISQYLSQFLIQSFCIVLLAFLYKKNKEQQKEILSLKEKLDCQSVIDYES